MTRWLVTGAAGMLGHDLRADIETSPDIKLTALTRSQLDLAQASPAQLRQVVTDHDLVINTAAWTDVDAAESDEDAATEINGHAVARLARACAETGARLVQLSTDYVFAGNATVAYPEDAPTEPVNAYGRGKLVGEVAVRQLLPRDGYVVRTAWLYGAHGRNFVSTMLRLAAERDTVDVVDDQVGQPTWTGALATHLVALGRAAIAGTAPGGIYHGTASGATSWFGLAQAVFTAAGLDPRRVRPTTNDAFPRPARRPAFSVLDHGAWRLAGLPPMADWHRMLAQALAEPDFDTALRKTRI
jgi:dTDP-4-dehydrorhamnose reductase